MLYISRYVRRDSFGVVDTSDGVEEVVTYDELHHICTDLGIDVCGVELVEVDNLMHLGCVEPYQMNEYVRPNQTKLRMIHKIEVRTYKSIVTNIVWNNNDIVVPVRIKLSDLGRVCGDCVFSGNYHSGVHKVTLVLDDSVEILDSAFKVRMTDDSFMSVNGVGVMIDVRGIKSEDKALKAYRSFFNGDVATLVRSVIDNLERKDRIVGVMM